MNIGDTSQVTGLPVKTIRYYEELGLVSPTRAANGYRDFSEQDVDRLRFVAQSRLLGFSLEECRRLLDFYMDENRTSREVREIARGHLEEVRRKIEDLRSLEGRLERMISACNGNDDPHCAIIDDLSGAAHHH